MTKVIWPEPPTAPSLPSGLAFSLLSQSITAAEPYIGLSCFQNYHIAALQDTGGGVYPACTIQQLVNAPHQFVSSFNPFPFVFRQ